METLLQRELRLNLICHLVGARIYDNNETVSEIEIQSIDGAYELMIVDFGPKHIRKSRFAQVRWPFGDNPDDFNAASVIYDTLNVINPPVSIPDICILRNVNGMREGR